MELSFHEMMILIHDILSVCIRVVMLCVVPAHREVGAATAWLLVIFLWPIPGFLFYLVFGTRRISKIRIRRHEEMVKQLEQEAGIFRAACETARDLLPEGQQVFGELAERLGDMPVTGSNRFRLFDDPPAFVNSLARDVDDAGSEVNLLFYIFEEDPVTEPLIGALERAARRGVDCRLLVDALGSKKYLKRQARRLIDAGVRVEAALPLSWTRRTQGTARFDLRNHRKLAVVDGTVAYMGSHNLIDPTYGGKAQGKPWIDLTLRLVGPVVRELQAVFLEDWYVETQEHLDKVQAFPLYSSGICGEEPRPGVPAFPERSELLSLPEARDILVQTVPSGPTYPTWNFQRLVVSALHSARRRVIITTPYLIPDEGLLQGLETACLSGVEVILIVPEHSDQFLVGHAARAFYEPILQMGVSLMLFPDGILHAKTMTVDEDLAFLGTSNFDLRSFALNFELNLLLYGSAPTGTIRVAQERYLVRSRRLSLEEWQKRPYAGRVLEGASKLFSPIL
jgi:cardiolipin synthase